MRASDLQGWRRGDKLEAQHLDEVVQVVKRQGDIAGGPGILIATNSNGTMISLAAAQPTGKWFYGKITGNGPKKEADYTDNRYWATCELLYPTGDATTLPVLKDDISCFGLTAAPPANPPPGATTPPPVYYNTVSATNLAEQKDSTHYLQYGTIVYCFEVYELGQPAVPNQPNAGKPHSVARWVFFSPDPGRGQYPGQVLLTEAANTRQWSFITAVPSLT